MKKIHKNVVFFRLKTLTPPLSTCSTVCGILASECILIKKKSTHFLTCFDLYRTFYLSIKSQKYLKNFVMLQIEIFLFSVHGCIFISPKLNDLILIRNVIRLIYNIECTCIDCFLSFLTRYL